jgi:hypothetical protein
MNELSEIMPVKATETPAPETPASEAIETAVAPAKDETAWAEEPANVPSVIDRMVDTARSWLTTQTRRGWPLMVFLMLNSVGGWTRICGPKMRKAAQELQAQHEACREVINSHTPATANQAWQAQGKKLSSAIGSGTITEHTGRTREDWEADFDQKLKSAHARQREIYISFQPIAQVLTARMVAILKEKLVRIEEDERSRYLIYGMDYSESPLLKELRKSVRTAEARATEIPNATTSPRDCVPWFDL